MPGETFSIELEGEDQIHLTRRNDELAPLVDVDYHPLFEKIGVAGVLAVFKAILAEGHVILVSSDIELLARCAQAALGLLYPFVWQHIYVPVLPASWLDYVTAPMPFVVGIHSSMLDQVLEMPLEESLLIAKLDSGEVMLCGEAGGHGCRSAEPSDRIVAAVAPSWSRKMHCRSSTPKLWSISRTQCRPRCSIIRQAGVASLRSETRIARQDLLRSSSASLWRKTGRRLKSHMIQDCRVVRIGLITISNITTDRLCVPSDRTLR